MGHRSLPPLEGTSECGYPKSALQPQGPFLDDQIFLGCSNVLNLAMEARFTASTAATMSPAYTGVNGSALFFCVEVRPGGLLQQHLRAWYSCTCEFNGSIFAQMLVA